MIADEQAREVEVVARELYLQQARSHVHPDDEETPEEKWNSHPFKHLWLARARPLLAALEPIRAAERQEAAREAFEEGVDAGRDDCCGVPWDQPKWIDRERPTNPYRADGVTGRSET